VVTEVWRRLPLEKLAPSEAVARAMALLDDLADGPVLAWSMVDAPALVLGRSADDQGIDRAACRSAGVQVLRRASGGGPVLWDRDLLALDVALPAGHRLAGRDVVLSYRWFGEALAAALRELGAPARTLSLDEARAAPSAEDRLAARVCFGGRSPFEVVVDGRKVVGLAQVRRRAGALFQAGIALRLDPRALTRLLQPPPEGRAALEAAIAARAGGLAGMPTPDRVVESVERAIAAREEVVTGG
jgi:lipoate-protein ligase A